MSKDQKNLKRPNTALEDQFEFAPVQKWRNGNNQKVLGSKIVVNKASNIVGNVNTLHGIYHSKRRSLELWSQL
jgi:hypothetical protein